MHTFIKQSLALLLLLAAALLLCACGVKESPDHPASSKSTTTPANDSASAYKRAQKHLARSEYTQAAEVFTALGSYEDSSMLAMYSRACATAEAGDYQTAIAALESMGSYKDCVMRVTYYKARVLEAATSDDEWPAMMEAQAIYCSIPLFLDSQERIAALDGRIEAAKAAQYDAAVAAGEAGDYQTAVDILYRLGDYLDCDKRITYYYDLESEPNLTYHQDSYYGMAAHYACMGDYLDCPSRAASMMAQADAIVAEKYTQADTLIAAGQYEEAHAFLEQFGSYGAEQIPAKYYAMGEHAMAAGYRSTAVWAYNAAGNYADAAERADALRPLSVLISSGDCHTVGLRPDRTVVVDITTYSSSFDQPDHVWGWYNIVAVAAGGDYFDHNGYTVGLQADGSVVAVGDNKYSQCNVSRRNNIVAIAAGAGHTVGLCANGTVVAVGNNYQGACEVSDWRNIVAVDAGENHTVGLRADGSVLAVGSNFDGECDVSGWQNIIAIAANNYCTVGLRSDGTVVAVGFNSSGQCDVSDWHGITAIATGGGHTVGLCGDGTVVAVGGNSKGQCNVSAWRDIVAISASAEYTIGLCSDGSVVVAGDASRCNVSSWDLID